MASGHPTLKLDSCGFFHFVRADYILVLQTMDALRFAFAFLMFHRRTVIGILLLIGLYFFFTEILPRIPRPERTPRAQSDDSGVTVETDNGETGDSGARAPTARSTNQVLRSGNLDELFQELIRLKDLSLQTTNDGITLALAGDIVKIAKKILELPISSDQRRFALGAFAESMLVMRLINVTSKMADDAIDAQFLHTTEGFLDDPDPRISSYAAMTIVAAMVFEFQKYPTQENLNRLEASLDSNFDNLAKLPLQVDRIFLLMLRCGLPVEEKVDTKDFFNRLVQRLRDHPNQQVKDVGEKYESELAFSHLNLANLVHRLDRSETSDQRVDQYFETLSRFPNSSIPIYQVGMDIIREYIVQGRNDRAQELIVMVDTQILPVREDIDSKGRIQKALDELKGVNSQRR
jgi:hypothetical protein